MDDLQLLNCKRPDIILRVTQHVPEIIKFIEQLIRAKRAYVTPSGSVYFNTLVFKIKSFFEQVEAETQTDSKGILFFNTTYSSNSCLFIEKIKFSYSTDP